MALRAPLNMKFDFRNPLTGRFCDEFDYDSAVSDIKHIRKTIKGLREPDEHVDCDGDGVSCDCFVSEIVMLSIGYAEVYRDGDVVSGGRTIYKEEDD